MRDQHHGVAPCVSVPHARLVASVLGCLQKRPLFPMSSYPRVQLTSLVSLPSDLSCGCAERPRSSAASFTTRASGCRTLADGQRCRAASPRQAPLCCKINDVAVQETRHPEFCDGCVYFAHSTDTCHRVYCLVNNVERLAALQLLRLPCVRNQSRCIRATRRQPRHRLTCEKRTVHCVQCRLLFYAAIACYLAVGDAAGAAWLTQ